MTRYIDADALKEWLQILPNATYTDMVLNTIDDLPTIDAEPVRHGVWIETEENHGFDDEVRNKAIACSVCNVAFRLRDYSLMEDYRYCPNCGARMDEND